MQATLNLNTATFLLRPSTLAALVADIKSGEVDWKTNCEESNQEHLYKETIEFLHLIRYTYHILDGGMVEENEVFKDSMSNYWTNRK